MIKYNHSISTLVKQGGGILLGSLIYAIGLSWFLLPFKVAPGGVGGLSQLFLHFFGWNAGISMLIMNIPLWLLGIFFIGKEFGFGTFIGFFISSLMVDIVAPARLYKWGFFIPLIEKYNTVDGHLKPLSELAMTDEIFIATIAGSILLGVGIGLIFKSRASTGGTDIPVAFLKKKLNISVGNGYLIIETSIILFTGIMFGDLNLVIWSYFALFLSSKFVDMVTEGLARVKAAHIICSDNEAAERIKMRIFDELDRGVTYFYGEGGYLGEEKKILFVSLSIRQTAQLKYIVLYEDKDAFIVMHDVFDVIGSGFKSRGLNL
ncbi:MAG: YitT family protein [Spirochaetaceae bacterium]|jgi:uncharacterized membrane-anchored protein YitT (DUF2179 family)|nr:YitT family protein [Spirochaetaceae bacterium]